tara:strand:+ start:88 stop:558 length:471 start_codon:yes stop_codon:yes gene_type:complete
MAKSFSYTSREKLPSSQVKRALSYFRNPSKWPEWNSAAKTMLATKAETIDEGDHLAIFQMIKGSLIEARWLVSKIREGPEFCEIQLTGEGQYRNERRIGRGVKNLGVCITFLYSEDGGIEVHSSGDVSRMMSVFSKQINSFMKKQSNQIIADLAKV